MMAGFRRAIGRVGPNMLPSGRMALANLRSNGHLEDRVFIPFSALQLVGGRRWSLSIIVLEPVRVVSHAATPVDRALAEEALDALTAEDADPAVAEALLRQALGR